MVRLRHAGTLRLVVWALGIVCSTGACSSSRGPDSEAKGSRSQDPDRQAGQSQAPDVPRLEPLAMGKADLAELAGLAGPCTTAFEDARAAGTGFAEAVAACRKQVRAGSPGVDDGAGAAAGHVDAHGYLALALARQGPMSQVAPEVVEHLSMAVAGDFLRWGDASLHAEELAGLYEMPLGQAYRQLVERYRERFRNGVAQAVLIVGRAGEPGAAASSGPGHAAPGGEIYAYELESRRYLRLSHTKSGVVGFLEVPGRSAVAFVSLGEVLAMGPAGAEPYMRKVEIGIVDLAEPAPGKQVVLDDVAELWLYHEPRAEGETRLMARVRAPRTAGKKTRGAAGVQALSTFSIDVAHGQAQPVVIEAPRLKRRGPKPLPTVADSPLRGDVLYVAHDRVERLRIPIADVIADWDETGAAGAFRLERTRKTVTLAAGELAHGHTMSWSPGNTRLVFATLPEDPCVEAPAEAPDGGTAAPGQATHASASLYVVEAATGTLDRLATGASPLAPRWIDERRLSYMDNSEPASSVRVVDVSTGEEVATLRSPGGVGTERLVKTSGHMQPCPPPGQATEP